MNEIDIEREKLKEVKSLISQIIEKSNKELEDFAILGGGKVDDNTLSLLNSLKNHVRVVEASMDKPYFARIDFLSYDDNVLNSLYIGKNGILDGQDIIVTDWRAPISDLYYSSNIGECSYNSPSGVISGKLNLKRQFIIEDGELQKYFDVDIVSNDQLLQQYLSDNNDSRLKSIVSTIQKEQNEVIRKPAITNLIVQGVAGSGKTTVALHRIAYLIYNNKGMTREKQYIIIGPNPVFLKYISNVLPDLDVSNAQQYTFEQFAKRFIEEDINIINQNPKLNKTISRDIQNSIKGFKSSDKYRVMIEKFMEDYVNSIFSEDLMIGTFKVLDKKYIKEVFESIHQNLSSMSFKDRIELSIQKLTRYMEINMAEMTHRFSDWSYNVFKSAKNDEEKDKLRTELYKKSQELRSCCKPTLRKYFSKAKVQSTKLYKTFLNNITKYNDSDYEYISELKKIALENLKNDNYEFEDLAPLMLIKDILSGKTDLANIKHVVVDEAQDYGEFNYYIFKKVMPNANFSIFGDLAQSIYDYRSINSWEQVNNIMFNGSGEIVEFGKSYRTTAEIMSVADSISSHIGLHKSELSIRHGEPVGFTHVKSGESIPETISKTLNQLLSKGYKTIGIISKTELLCRYLEDDLNDLGVKITRINQNDDLNADSNKICNISSFLAKGLEFDAIIINDASEKIYSSSSSLDMKLLYVAITRALHEVQVVYSGELSAPLKQYEIQSESIRTRS